jgi:hypothetical protein
MLDTVVLVAALACNQAMAKAEMRSAMQTFDRLHAAIVNELPNATPQEEASRRAALAEVENLKIYFGKVAEVLDFGRWDDAYLQQTITVARQRTVACSNVAVLPEEALCWERAYLNYVAALRMQMVLRAKTGIGSAKAVDQANAAYEAARKSYAQALARCLTSID